MKEIDNITQTINNLSQVLNLLPFIALNSTLFELPQNTISHCKKLYNSDLKQIPYGAPKLH